MDALEMAASLVDLGEKVGGVADRLFKRQKERLAQVDIAPNRQNFIDANTGPYVISLACMRCSSQSLPVMNTPSVFDCLQMQISHTSYQNFMMISLTKRPWRVVLQTLNFEQNNA